MSRQDFPRQSIIHHSKILPNSYFVNYEIGGKGTISLKMRAQGIDQPNFWKFGLKTDQEKPMFELIISNGDIQLKSFKSNFKFNKEIIRQFPFDLVTFKSVSWRWIWVSVDRANCLVKVGHGYTMTGNVLTQFQMQYTTKNDEIDNFFEKIKILSVELGDVIDSKYWRQPVTIDPPMFIVNSKKKITLLDINRSTMMPCSELPIEAQGLYGSVADLFLTDEEINAINYSLDTAGCALHEKLKQKSMAQYGIPDAKMTYIRCTVGVNQGNSPGNSFVLEIWPKMHFSPIHNHGNSVAIIKVLHGRLNCICYNPLPDESTEEVLQVGQTEIKKDDITWINPEFYQTHKLKNVLDNSMSATIQSYRFLNTDNVHHERFDYIDDRYTELKFSRPSSDFTYEELLDTVSKEYNNRPNRNGLANITSAKILQNKLTSRIKNLSQSNKEEHDVIKNDTNTLQKQIEKLREKKLLDNWFEKAKQNGYQLNQSDLEEESENKQQDFDDVENRQTFRNLVQIRKLDDEAQQLRLKSAEIQ